MSEHDFNKFFSKNLNFYLAKAGKSQAELAKYMNISTASVSNWCKGIKLPRMDKVDKICLFLHVNRSDLMDTKSYSSESHRSYILSSTEYDFIQKYRELDERGKAMVDSVLEQAYNSRPRIMEGQLLLDIGETIHTKFGQDIPNAAHARTDIKPTADDVKHDEDIMDDDNF